jgi:UDP-N-acetylmuramyl tripeptide synthase
MNARHITTTTNSAASTPSKKLVACDGNCPEKKTGYIKFVAKTLSPSNTQSSFLGAEYNPSNGIITPIILRVYESTDEAGRMQSMLSQLIDRNGKNSNALIRFSLKAASSLGCKCGPFATYPEKAHVTNKYDR